MASKTLCCCSGNVEIISMTLLCSIVSLAFLTCSLVTFSESSSKANSPAFLSKSSAYLASPSSFAAIAEHKGITSLSKTSSLKDNSALSVKISDN